MKTVNLFSFDDNNDRTVERHSMLFYLNDPTGVLLEGNEIAGQYVVDSFYLLIITEQVAWGEIIYFYLLNLKFELIDQLSISGDLHSSFFLSDLKIVGNNAIEFNISGVREKCTLIVLAKPKFNMPNFNPYSVVWRPAFTKQLMTNFELKGI